MGDVADILGLSPAVGDESDQIVDNRSKRSHRSTKKAKPKGVPREVYEIMESDGNLTPLVADPSQLDLVTRMKDIHVHHWVWNKFKSSAREDGLELHHWERKNVEYIDYPFAKFNYQIYSLDYTDAEYYDCNIHDDWSREETDYLFSLCKKYDLRWHVIADRYNRKPIRSMEECKLRYYRVCNRVLTYRRANIHRQLTKTEIELSNFEYNIMLDIQRNTQLDKSFVGGNKSDEKSVNYYQQELMNVDNILKRIKSKAPRVRNTELDQYITDDNINSVLNGTFSLFTTPIPQQGVFRRGYQLYDKPEESHVNGEIFKMVDKILVELGTDPHLPMVTEKTIQVFNAIKLKIVSMLIIQKYIGQKMAILCPESVAAPTTPSTPQELNLTPLNEQYSSKRRRSSPQKVNSQRSNKKRTKYNDEDEDDD